MPKRKEVHTPSKLTSTPNKCARKSLGNDDESAQDVQEDSKKTTNGQSTPSKRPRNGNTASNIEVEDLSNEEEEGSPTPKINGTTLFATPSTKRTSSKDTPSRSVKADRSAKRKSARTLTELEGDEEDWDNAGGLAEEILYDAQLDGLGADTIEADANNTASELATPSKRGRGRPKGAKNKRSPTPEGDLPPEERYFFQNRTGPVQMSNNSFSALGLLSHDEYLESLQSEPESHELEIAYLMKQYTRSFPQWEFELDQGFSVCLYGWGSKRMLVNKFAEYIYERATIRGTTTSQPIVVVNGCATKINIRIVLNTIASALRGEDGKYSSSLKLVGPPQEMLDTILSQLSTSSSTTRLFVLINSIDGASLRRPSIQSLLSRLAADPRIDMLVTADTPTFPVLWNSTVRNNFNFAFHDCTTFARYDGVETNPIDDVHELLGRKGRRVGGKEGIGFVLRSLPENARNLYRVLLTEVLGILGDETADYLDKRNGVIGDEDDEMDTQEYRKTEGGRGRENAEEVGIEYRALYQKASEEFICSSDMNFRFLLKEFHDHQMLTSMRDASGTELLGVPLSRDEMSAVLEDLVIG